MFSHYDTSMNTTKQPLFPWKTLHWWYKNSGRHSLPWRQYDLPREQLVYRVWLSEILLQQTQAERVREYFERIIKRYPTIESLSRTSYDEFFGYYQGLGYYSRARNLLKTAKIIQDDYCGIFPDEYEKLIKLPWVWPYTAQAIQSFGYNIPKLAWDTNLEKVFSRYTTGSKYNLLGSEKKWEILREFEHFVQENTTASESNIVRDINNALMDFSSLIDLKNPNQIDWENYPIRSWIWYETRWSIEPIIQKAGQYFPTPDANIIVILHEWHKTYYSENTDKFCPWILHPSLSRNTRKYVQDTFREQYWLEISVRPAHKKWFSNEGKPFIVVNAQIQRWRGNFREYSREEFLKYTLPI